MMDADLFEFVKMVNKAMQATLPGNSCTLLEYDMYAYRYMTMDELKEAAETRIIPESFRGGGQ